MNRVAKNISEIRSDEYPVLFQSKKAGRESIYVPASFFLFTRIPFAGVYWNLFNGNFQKEYLYFLLIDIALIGMCVFLYKKYYRISFGYDANGVFYNGAFKKKEISWGEIRSIGHIREYKVWSDIDVVGRNSALVPRRLFVYEIVSDREKIYIPRHYSEADVFIRYLAGRSGIGIDYEEKGFWRWLGSFWT